MKKIVILLVAVFMVATLFSTPVRAQKEWTVGVFLNGDNNLEGAGIDDITEMEKIGSNDDLNIVVQFDRANGHDTSHGDWKGTKIFYVTKDSNSSTIGSKVVKDLGEADMGDWKELVKFAKFLKSDYPAKKYLIIVWNHGAGWKFTGEKETIKGLSYDDSSNNHMTVQDIAKAMSAIKKLLGKNLDIFGMDACLMQMAEVSYEYRNDVDYVVASEETEPGDGWPYEDFLKLVDRKPNISAADFAKGIAKVYASSYSGGSQGSRPGCTQSALDCSKLEKVTAAIDEFGKAIVDNIEEISEKVTSAIRGADAFYYSDYKDAYHFAKLMSNSPNKTVNSKAKAVMVAIDNCVIANYVSKGYYAKHENAYGLSLYIPREYQYRPNYEDLLFAKDSNWDEALKATFAINAKVSDVKAVIAAVISGEASPEFLAIVLKIKANIDDEESFNAFIDELQESKNYNLIKTANLLKENLTNKEVNERSGNPKYIGKLINLIK
ncbi:hypothetical protein KAJ27_15840 [bacterium]|nr:hypothetical protein [bacterium]